jgi:methionine aminopeptidase
VLKGLKAVKDSKGHKVELPQAHKEPLVQGVLRVHKGLLDQQ